MHLRSLERFDYDSCCCPTTSHARQQRYTTRSNSCSRCATNGRRVQTIKLGTPPLAGGYVPRQAELVRADDDPGAIARAVHYVLEGRLFLDS